MKLFFALYTHHAAKGYTLNALQSNYATDVSPRHETNAGARLLFCPAIDNTKLRNVYPSRRMSFNLEKPACRVLAKRNYDRGGVCAFEIELRGGKIEERIV